MERKTFIRVTCPSECLSQDVDPAEQSRRAPYVHSGCAADATCSAWYDCVLWGGGRLAGVSRTQERRGRKCLENACSSISFLDAWRILKVPFLKTVSGLLRYPDSAFIYLFFFYTLFLDFCAVHFDVVRLKAGCYETSSDFTDYLKANSRGRLLTHYLISYYVFCFRSSDRDIRRLHY